MDKPMLMPQCCNEETVWVDNIPGKEYVYCRACKKEYVEPNKVVTPYVYNYDPIIWGATDRLAPTPVAPSSHNWGVATAVCTSCQMTAVEFRATGNTACTGVPKVDVMARMQDFINSFLVRWGLYPTVIELNQKAYDEFLIESAGGCPFYLVNQGASYFLGIPLVVVHNNADISS